MAMPLIKQILNKLAGQNNRITNLETQYLLYSGNISEGQTVTLSDDINNYKYLILEWYGTFRILAAIPTGSGLIRVLTDYYNDDDGMSIAGISATSSTKSFKLVKISAFNIAKNSTCGLDTGAPKYLTKIFGIK